MINLKAISERLDKAQMNHAGRFVQLTGHTNTIELYKHAETDIATLLDAVQEALKYCEGHTDKMWAASIVAKLTGTDFRDAKKTLEEIFGEKAKDE